MREIQIVVLISIVSVLLCLVTRNAQRTVESEWEEMGEQSSRVLAENIESVAKASNGLH